MKNVVLFLIAALTIASCASPDKEKGNTDTVINSDTSAKTDATPDITSLCFIKTDGKSNQDTTSIELVIQSNKVTGQMNWMPYQKDSRKGALEGTLQNDTLKAVWGFMQEGMKDTLNLSFLLKDGELSQKPLKLNTKTGREQTDASANYTLKYFSTTKVHH